MCIRDRVAGLYDACPDPVEPTRPDNLELVSGETKLVLTEDYLQGVEAGQTPADIIAKFNYSENVVIVNADGSAPVSYTHLICVRERMRI